MNVAGQGRPQQTSWSELRARMHTESAALRRASRALVERARELRLRSVELCRVNIRHRKPQELDR